MPVCQTRARKNEFLFSQLHFRVAVVRQSYISLVQSAPGSWAEGSGGHRTAGRCGHHRMSSQMEQLPEYPIEKPADFHPDFALAV
jgi:hypothetical protein